MYIVLQIWCHRHSLAAGKGWSLVLEGWEPERQDSVSMDKMVNHGDANRKQDFQERWWGSNADSRGSVLYLVPGVLRGNQRIVTVIYQAWC